MRVVSLTILVIIFCGCTGVPSTPLMPHATETIAAALTRVQDPGETPVRSIPTVNSPELVIATPGSAPTVVPPCDPASNDYCIVADHLLFSRPILPPGNDRVEVTYRYGATQNGVREPHHGAEFPNSSGTPVVAVSDGEVVFAGSDLDSLLSPWPNFYGKAVVIEHAVGGQKVFSLYGHLSQVDVVAGQTVTSGEKIGEVGREGAAIGSHLHFEVRLDENDYISTRNPDLWLIPREGAGVVAIRVTDKENHFLPVNMNIQRVLDDGAFEVVPQAEAYNFKEKNPIASDDDYQENFALSDIPAGRYRLTIVYLGKLIERFVEVEAGKLTLVDISIK